MSNGGRGPLKFSLPFWLTVQTEKLLSPEVSQSFPSSATPIMKSLLGEAVRSARPRGIGAGTGGPKEGTAFVLCGTRRRQNNACAERLGLQRSFVAFHTCSKTLRIRPSSRVLIECHTTIASRRPTSRQSKSNLTINCKV